MRLRENMMDIYAKLIDDEELLRWLFYKSKSLNDNILLETPDRPNIKSRPDYWDIVEQRIKPMPKVDDLDKEPICRILFFPDRRRGDKGRYQIADQEVVVDVLVHQDYQNDFRYEAICDRISQLIQGERVTGIGESDFTDGIQLRFQEMPKTYVGYRIKFNFGSVKK